MKPGPKPKSQPTANELIKEIKRRTRRLFSSEEKIRIVLADYSRLVLTLVMCDGMRAPDVMKAVDKALAYTGTPPNKRPKLLSDNGSCYISAELKSYLDKHHIKSVHGRPCHPQTQGKIERYHRTMKNTIKLDNYYSPEELERALECFVWYYTNVRYHETLKT